MRSRNGSEPGFGKKLLSYTSIHVMYVQRSNITYVYTHVCTVSIEKRERAMVKGPRGKGTKQRHIVVGLASLLPPTEGPGIQPRDLSQGPSNNHAASHVSSHGTKCYTCARFKNPVDWQSPPRLEAHDVASSTGLVVADYFKSCVIMCSNEPIRHAVSRVGQMGCHS